MLAVMVPLGAGCREFYWANTTLRSDGSVERAVYQPAASLPSPYGWLEYRTVAKPTQWDAPWPESPDDLQLPEQDSDTAQQYVFARGHFATVDQIPSHFRVSTPDEARSAELMRLYERTSYGWYTEHHWQETLTDVISLTDMRQARRELADALIALLEEILRQAYGDTLDSRQLLEWLRSEGVAWCEELSDAFYETCQLPDGHKRWQSAIQKVLDKRGLSLSLTDEGQENAVRLRQFISAKLQMLLRQPDGQPVSPEVVAEITDFLVPPPDTEQPEEGRLQNAAARSIERLYGSREVWEKNLQAHLARIVGVHFLASGVRQFRYDLTVPGIIVETNGILHHDNRVRWEFAGEAAYPNGYRMVCRSLEPHVEVQRALWGETRFGDRESLTRLHALVQRDEEVRKKIASTTRPEQLETLRHLIQQSSHFAPGEKQWLLNKLQP